LKVGIVGYGRMGHMVEEVALARGHEIVARVDSAAELTAALASSPPLGGAEVVIEFTHPSAAPGALMALATAGIPTVSGTTGWEDQREAVRGAVESAREQGAALLHAPNFALGVNLFFRLTRALGRLVESVDDLDVHLLEIHHRHKLDHPSGTARRLADILVEEITRKTGWSDGQAEGAPDPAVLQIASARAGENPGTHIIGVEGPDDRIEIRHEARGRRGFARGAVEAAEWLAGRRGVFTPDEWLAERFG